MVFKQLHLKDQGFTYLELIVVIGLMSVMLCIASLSTNVFSRVQDQQALDREVRILHKTMVEARNQSMMDGRRRQILITKDSMYFQTLFPSKTVTTKISYHPHLKLVTNTYNTQKLTFYPEGTVSAGGTITLQNQSGKKKTIVVQIGSGRIYWKEGD